MRVNTRSTDADVGRLSAGDEAAHLGHEDDEGHLAHIGGFARHVGAGDDGAPGRPAVHMGVVGDKEGCPSAPSPPPGGGPPG